MIEPTLCFLGVASPEGWHGQYDRVQAAFRRANPAKQTDNAAITAWLRLGELQALKADIPAFSAEKLQASIADLRFTTFARVPYRLLEQVSVHTPTAKSGACG